MTVKETKCTKCGARYDASAKFCGLDRSPLVPAEPDVQKVTARACPKCYRLYPSDAAFCPVDGSRLEAKRGALTASWQAQQPKSANPGTRPAIPVSDQSETGTVISV
ncbi:MAG TPA: zinc ribbon domain-containing protein, partial [Chroococcales cyanobacterium]